ncbi:MAG TPA: hypothetical protein VJ249_08415 [Candidatus Bathyarchaeia archaeon]|nr:hypothetical protein [Candidatus Bathyarchaeia archaeon]
MVSLLRKRKPKNRQEDETKPEAVTVQYLLETVKTLQKENELLKRDLSKSRRTPTATIASLFLILGALALAGSYISTSTVLAFIGLGLAFWGALFLFARPIKFVRSTLLDSTAISSYTTIDRIIDDLGYKGRPVYIPPYPKEAYLPDYLKSLKEMIVFIPAEEVAGTPTIEVMAKKQFLLRNPRGICIAPPGYGLTDLFEKELKTEFTKIDLDQLFNSLPTIIVNNLELAKEVELSSEDNLVHVKIIGSVYRELYLPQQGLRSIHKIGCPLTSAIACALAKTTAKLVTLAKDSVSTDLQTIEAWYQTLEA